MFQGYNNFILFAGERGCWPDPDKHIQYPESGTPYRFLNAGVLGSAGIICALLREHLEDHMIHEEFDQRFWTNLYLSHNHKRLISIDTAAAIFQTMHQSDTDVQLVRYDTDAGFEGAIFNTITHTAPLVFQANGGNKEHNLEYLGHMRNLINGVRAQE